MFDHYRNTEKTWTVCVYFFVFWIFNLFLKPKYWWWSIDAITCALYTQPSFMYSVSLLLDTGFVWRYHWQLNFTEVGNTLQPSLCFWTSSFLSSSLEDKYYYSGVSLVLFPNWLHFAHANLVLSTGVHCSLMGTWYLSPDVLPDVQNDVCVEYSHTKG